MIVPISELSLEYAKDVRRRIRKAGHHVEVDASDRKMQKKVREAQLEQFNYILVVGEQEKTNDTVNVRTRDNQVHGERKLEEKEKEEEEETRRRSRALKLRKKQTGKTLFVSSLGGERKVSQAR